MGFTYLPSQERQIKPSDKWGKYNCGAVATAVAVDRATLGGVMVNGEDIRRLTDEPVPDPKSPGLRVSQLCAAAKKLHVDLTEVKGGTFGALLSRLAEGRGVVLAGAGASLGTAICQVGFTGGHALMVNNLSTDHSKVVVYNPLCATRRYLPVATVRKYAEAFGSLHGGLNWAYTRITPNVTELAN